MSAGAHSDRARAALAAMPEIDPAISALALWCQHRDGDKPTHTDGAAISYGPEFPLLPFREQTGLLAHHVLHVALRHSARRAVMAEREGARFDADLYGLACDGLVNDALIAGGHALPQPVVRAQELVALLPETAQKPGALLAQWDCDGLYLALTAQRGGQGGTAGDAARSYAERKGFGDDLEAREGAGEDGDEVWAARVEAALQAGRGAGAGIGAHIAHLADLPRPRIPWERRLRRLLARALHTEPRRSHRRPAKHWIARDALARRQGGPIPVFEPGVLRDKERARLVIGIDSSSSITDAQLRMFASEALSAVRKSGAEALLLGFDTEVHLKTQLTAQSVLEAMQMRRDGGTDFTDVLRQADLAKPSLIVMMTDLDAPLGETPNAPVLWLAPKAPARRPAFGEVLEMAF